MRSITSKFHSDAVKSAWKYVYQLRVQHQKNKASLVLGAGISWDLNLPLWDELIDRIKNAIIPYAPEAKNVSEAPGKAALVLFEIFHSYKIKEISTSESYKNNDNIIEKKYYLIGAK